MTECPFAYYSAGGAQAPCSYCGYGFNTTNATMAAEGEPGSDSPADCKLDFGFQNSTSGAAGPCLRGWYKDRIGNVLCTRCPLGTSTTVTYGAVAKTDCDACRPGFGVSALDGKIVLPEVSDASCVICGSGEVSAGYASGGQRCLPCPQAQNFSGRMVSRKVGGRRGSGYNPGARGGCRCEQRCTSTLLTHAEARQ